MKAFWVKLDVFGWWIQFRFGDHHKKRISQLVKGDFIPTRGNGYHNGNLVWCSDESDESVLVHEIYHATQWLIGELGLDNREAGAYICGYLYEQSIDKYRKWKESIKKKGSEDVQD